MNNPTRRPLTLDQIRGFRELFDTAQVAIDGARAAVLAEDIGKAALHAIHAERCLRDVIANLHQMIEDV